jgi:hypothetical protein
MGVGPNYVLDKGHLATGSTAYAFGELVVPAAGEQSMQRATSAGAPFCYVCQEDVDATRLATGKVIADARILGIARVIAGAAVAKSSKLTNDATARAIVQAGAVGSGAPVFGIALTAAANAGDHIDVLLTPGATA